MAVEPAHVNVPYAPVTMIGTWRRDPSPFARRYQTGCWRVIEGVGELDIRAVPSLADLTTDGPSHVVFDFRLVTFTDAAVLGVLAATRDSLGRRHGAVHVVGACDMVRHVLAITRLDAVLPMFDSMEDAFAGHESC